MPTEISDRQLEIIGAAGKLLASVGVSGLTIKNLAREMRFSESAIYRHFASKEDIIVAMLDFLATDMERKYAGLSFDNQNPEEKMRLLLQSHFRFFREKPFFTVALFSDGLFEASQQINASILKIMVMRRKFLTPLVEEGQQSGMFTADLPAEALVHIVMGSIRLLMFKWRVAQFDFDIEKAGDELLNNLFKLIKCKKSAEGRVGYAV